MSESPAIPPTEVAAEASRTVRPGGFRRSITAPSVYIPLGILVLITLLSALAPAIAPYDPERSDLANAMCPFSSEHWMGCDGAGRDMLSRLLFAGRYSLAGAALVVVVAALIGLPTGLLAGYFGRWFDSVSSWCTSMLQSLPAMVVLLAVSAAVGRSLWVSMAVFGVLMSTGFFRLTRTMVLAVKNELYVDAARVAGLSNTRIIGRHIFTVVRAPIIIQAAFIFGIGVTMQAGLEFLGLGDRTKPSYGGMLNEAFGNVFLNPKQLLWPSIVIALVMACSALLGNGLRDVLEGSRDKPKSKDVRRAKARATERAATAPQREHPSAVLEVDGICVGYPDRDGTVNLVVDHVSLHVQRGEVLGLVGESGSGKTQTAFSVLGLLPETAVVPQGNIWLEDHQLTGMTPRQLQQQRGVAMAYIPQEPMSNLDPSFKIGSQLMEPMRAQLGLKKREAKAKALALLERVGIPDPQRTFAAYPHEVSGGMAQRVLIARAVSCDPQLLIADEPTTALDVTVQAEVLALLRSLQKERNMGLILVTHNFGVVADICDRVAVMQHGTIVEENDVFEVFAHPRHPYTTMLLESTLEDAAIRTLDRPAPAGGPGGAARGADEHGSGNQDTKETAQINGTESATRLEGAHK